MIVPRRGACVILAAGASARMGRPKAALSLGGRTLLERALAAAAAFPTVVVVAANLPPDVARVLATAARSADVTVVVNERAERGMSRSLGLADAAVLDRTVPLGVLLLDTPLVDAALVARIFTARGSNDVAYPVRAGIAGHPVVFGARARAAIAELPVGDTVRALRDDPRWTRVAVEIDDDAPFLDIDTESDFTALTARFALDEAQAGAEKLG
jgi:CTP:molybdopterin cytidylyltransferase MocA